MSNNQQLYGISTEEYFYLTENFAFVDARTRANQVKYLVYNKDKKIMDTMQKVMENELTEKERGLAIDYWSNNLSISDISKKHNISKSSFYRAIGEIKKKIDVSLKYVLFYNDIIKPPSIAEFLSQINSEFSLGEQIENWKNHTLWVRKGIWKARENTKAFHKPMQKRNRESKKVGGLQRCKGAWKETSKIIWNKIWGWANCITAEKLL